MKFYLSREIIIKKGNIYKRIPYWQTIFKIDIYGMRKITRHMKKEA